MVFFMMTGESTSVVAASPSMCRSMTPWCSDSGSKPYTVTSCGPSLTSSTCASPSRSITDRKSSFPTLLMNVIVLPFNRWRTISMILE